MSVTAALTFDGLFKQVYADTILDLVPEAAKLSKMIKFVPNAERNGDYYNQPVIVANEQGVTYAQSNTGAFALNNAVPLTMQNAQILPNQIIVRGQLSYDIAARSSTSAGAFKKGTVLLVENMMQSMYKRLEISLIYGGAGLMTTISYSNVSGTSTTITASAGQWATGIWAGAENSQLNFYNGTTQVNGSTGIFTVYEVNVANKSITVTGVAADITALQTAITNNQSTSLTTAFFNGAYGNEATGLYTIFNNTGLLFGINASLYNLWESNVSTTSGPLTMTKILNAVSLAVQRGLDEDVVVFVNPNTWTNLNTDLAALRRFDGSLPDEGDNGFESICYYGQNGKVEVISHNIVKEGDAFVLPTDRALRIGAQEISYTTPGMDQQIFLQLPNNAGYEFRLYTSQALLIETPARCVYITGFTND